MSDDTSKRGVADRSRVNPNEEYEIQCWSDKWNVSGEELRAAVEKAGPMVSEVAEELGREP